MDDLLLVYEIIWMGKKTGEEVELEMSTHTGETVLTLTSGSYPDYISLDFHFNSDQMVQLINWLQEAIKAND